MRLAGLVVDDLSRADRVSRCQNPLRRTQQHAFWHEIDKTSTPSSFKHCDYNVHLTSVGGVQRSIVAYSFQVWSPHVQSSALELVDDQVALHRPKTIQHPSCASIKANCARHRVLRLQSSHNLRLGASSSSSSSQMW